MATIELQKIEKRFGDSHAVKPLDLTINHGEFVVLLGPSGCGKTTTLRMISGLEAVTGGKILLNGKEVTWLHPSERDMAFVFQFYALYSHLSVRQNIAFPLQAQGMKHGDIDKRVKEVVDILRIGHLMPARPGKLSGGDQQRVALARALVRKPSAFLMDEPLGALDAEMRESMRAEIKNLHIAQHATTVYVTHDQVEAMAMGDRIVVMSKAEVQQVGTPMEVYYNPANLFVARFIGSPGMNLVKGTYTRGSVRMVDCDTYPVPTGWDAAIASSLGGAQEILLGFRPEAAHVSPKGTMIGEVYATDMHGAYTVLHVKVCEGEIVHIRSDRQTNYPIGTPVRFDIDTDMVRFFNPRTEAAIRREAAR
jgi:multiple sugar transport system ATP-binding protein